MGSGSVAGMLMRPWIGQWIDRIGARNMWLFGYSLVAAGSLSNLPLQELGFAVYLSRSLLVLGASIVFSSSLTYITHLAPPERRTEAIGSLGIAGFTGMVLGPAVGDFLLTEARTRDEFEFLFVTAAVVLIIPALLLLLLKPTPTEPRRKSTRLSDFVRIIRENWPGTIVLVLGSFGLCMTVPFVFLAKYVDEVGIRTDAVPTVTMFFICYSGVGVSIRVLARRIPDKLGRRKMLLAGTIVMGAGMLLFTLVDSEHSNRLVIPALMCGAGHGLMFHTCASLLLDHFPSEVRGVGSAFSMMVMDAAMISGAPILGWLALRYSYDVMFLSVSLFSLFSGCVYAISSIPVWRARMAARSQSS